MGVTGGTLSASCDRLRTGWENGQYSGQLASAQPTARIRDEPARRDHLLEEGGKGVATSGRSEPTSISISAEYVQSRSLA